MATQRVRTEGQRLLLALPGSVRQLADQLGGAVKFQSVHAWRTGDFLPSAKQRDKIGAVLGVPVSAWDQLPRDALPPVDVDDDEADADDDQGGDELEGDGSGQSLGQSYSQQIRELQKLLARRDLIGRDRLALNESLGKALERRRKYELQTEMLEDRTIRDHPTWQLLKQTIIDALLSHPAAARDVETAIERVLGDGSYR